MNILIFSAVFYPAIGGIESQTLLLIQEFVKKGHKVKVITYQQQKVTLPNIDIYYAPNYLDFLTAYRWCDTFYMPNISLKGLWLLLFNPRKRWVISHNDYHFFHGKGLIAKLKSFSVRYATKNIAVSNSIAHRLNTSSLTIPNSYDESIFKIYPDEKREYDFVFLGRLVTQKGCEMLIRACKELNRPFTLGIIGIGTEKDRLENLTKELRLTNEVTFHGLVTKENLARLLNRHKVMIIPSIGEEGFGMVALEGLACGCKILAADAGGLSDAVSSFARKFQMGDTQELIKLLKNSFDDHTPALTPELSAYLKLHHPENVADNYLQAFN
jgi:glycogen(starch) synthase